MNGVENFINKYVSHNKVKIITVELSFSNIKNKCTIVRPRTVKSVNLYRHHIARLARIKNLIETALS